MVIPIKTARQRAKTAEFERELIRERTAGGIEGALKERGLGAEWEAAGRRMTPDSQVRQASVLLAIQTAT